MNSTLEKAFVKSEHIVRGPAARIWTITIENVSAIKHCSACPTFINDGILCQPQCHKAEIPFTPVSEKVLMPCDMEMETL